MLPKARQTALRSVCEPQMMYKTQYNHKICEKHYSPWCSALSHRYTRIDALHQWGEPEQALILMKLTKLYTTRECNITIYT